MTWRSSRATAQRWSRPSRRAFAFCCPFLLGVRSRSRERPRSYRPASSWVGAQAVLPRLGNWLRHQLGAFVAAPVGHAAVAQARVCGRLRKGAGAICSGARLAALPTWVDSLRTGWPRRDLADFLLAVDHPNLLQELCKQKLAMEAPAIVLILHRSQTDPSNRVQQGHPKARRHARTG